MPVVAAVGAQWGDEGKGKIVDMLAEKASVVARYNGGNNAGHTVINHLGEFHLHLVPCGIFYPDTICIIGNGVVINPQALFEELDMLVGRGVNVENLRISDHAHVVMPYHIMLDRLEEQARGAKSIGTTGRGIGPAYADKVARFGIRIADLLDPDALGEKLGFILAQKNRILTKLYDAEPLSYAQVFERYADYGQRLARYVANTSQIIQDAIAANQRVLLEGAQGTLLDLDFGTYPDVTSSSPTSGAACAGLGIAPTQIDRALGVYKAFQTRVGSGPFPTELNNDLGEMIRDIGQEYGVSTGRPRRIGWFDAVLARYSARINGFQSVAITRLDILDTVPHLKICVKYVSDGVELDYPPRDLAKCEPVYEEYPGWLAPTGGAKRFEELPIEAQNYLNRLAELVGARLDMVGIGPKREQTIVLNQVL